MDVLTSFETVIVANGEIPTHRVALKLLRNASHIVCCDGGIRHLEQLGIPPTAIVGDGDSIPAELRRKYDHLFIKDSSQEYNDLTKAYNYCATQNWDDIAVLGAGGLREDHLLANLSLLLRHAHHFHTVMVTNYGVFTPIFQTRNFASSAGEAVSIFSFTPATRLTYSGLRYSVTERSFREFWEGSLNEAIGEQFRITLHDEGEILVYQAFKKENL